MLGQYRNKVETLYLRQFQIHKLISTEENFQNLTATVVCKQQWNWFVSFFVNKHHVTIDRLTLF